MDTAISMTQIIGIAITVILALIGTVWGVTRAMGKMVVKNLETTLGELKTELAAMRQEMKEISEGHIRQTEHMKGLEDRIGRAETRILKVEEEFKEIQKQHYKNHQ